MSIKGGLFNPEISPDRSPMGEYSMISEHQDVQLKSLKKDTYLFLKPTFLPTLDLDLPPVPIHETSPAFDISHINPVSK